jgi:hypothetical protein
MEVFKVKVVKNNGDFDKALKQGFAINNYACKESEMWLCMPSERSLMSLIKKHDWSVITDVEAVKST